MKKYLIILSSMPLLLCGCVGDLRPIRSVEEGLAYIGAAIIFHAVLQALCNK